MLFILLVVILIFALFGGIGYGYPRYGAWGYGPFGLLLLVFILLIAFGGVRYQ